MIAEGRTHPIVLDCRPEVTDGSHQRMLAKAIGCPEISSTWQLVTEVVGNATARRMGVQTSMPAVVHISDAMAGLINRSLRSEGLDFSVSPGPAAGCEFIPGLANFTVGQILTPELRNQAGKLFAFDLLSQNADRSAKRRINCGLTKAGLLAFDFELCFAHKFLPIIGRAAIEPWEPSKAHVAKDHLFYSEVRANPPSLESVSQMASALTVEWWEVLMGSLPDIWQPEAEKIGSDLRLIASHAQDFGKDITTRCLI